MVKSRKNPEESVSKRTLRSVATRGVGFSVADIVRDGEDDAPDRLDQHPLINPDARNSMVDSNRVVWPQNLTSYTSKKSDIPHHIAIHVRGRVLIPMLGKPVCAPYEGKNSAYTFVYVMKPVQVGLWPYGLSDREDIVKEDETEVVRFNRLMGKKRSSWFKIRSSDVPHYDTAPDHQHYDEFIYGRIIRFAQLTVPAWRPEPFQLAKVRLYAPHSRHSIAKLDAFNTQFPLQYYCDDARTKSAPIEYIQVQHLISCIAVAPVHPLAVGQKSSEYYALPIEV
jgi:hypothetical protein